SGKKISDIIFKPIIDELIVLDKTPIKIQIGARTESFYVRLLLTVADAPARATMLNTKSYLSRYGCNSCLCPSAWAEGASRWPMVAASKWPLRTDEQWRRDAKEIAKIKKNAKANSIRLSDNDEHIFGILGKCQIMRLKYISMNMIAPPEFMHSQMLGTVQ